MAQVAPPVEVKKHGHAQPNAFAAETAKISGQDKREVNRHLARGRALGSDLQAITGTSLDKGVELDALTKLDAPTPRTKRSLGRER